MADHNFQKTDLQTHNCVLFLSRKIVTSGVVERPTIVTDTESLPNILKTRDLALLLDMSPDAVNDLARLQPFTGW